jgi:hypothetical protein
MPRAACRVSGPVGSLLDVDRRTLRAEELPGDVEGLAAHDNDLLTIEELLRDRAGQATEQVALSVNDLGPVSSVLLRGRRRA